MKASDISDETDMSDICGHIEPIALIEPPQDAQTKEIPRRSSGAGWKQSFLFIEKPKGFLLF